MTPAVAVLEVCSEIDQEAIQANDAHAQIVGAERGTAALARKAGAALRAAKKRVGFGNWLAWLATNCPDIEERTAQEYMMIDREWCRLPDPHHGADLSIRQVRNLLADGRKPPTTDPIEADGPKQQPLFEELPFEARVPPPIPREETFEYKALLTRAAKVFGTRGDKAEAIYAALASHPALRHGPNCVGEAGSRMLERGAALSGVRDALGHASVTMTDTYLRARTSGLDETFKRLHEGNVIPFRGFSQGFAQGSRRSGRKSEKSA